MTEYEDIRTSTIAYVAVASVLATVLIVLGLQVAYYKYRNTLEASRRAEAPASSLEALERINVASRQRLALTQPRVVDKSNRIVTIPISLAMELVVKELNAGKPPAQVTGPSRPAARKTAGGPGDKPEQKN